MHKPFFPKGELENVVLGVLETACFLKQGVLRFGNTQGEAIRSFVVFAITLLFSYWILYYMYTEINIDAAIFMQICVSETIRQCVVMAFVLFAVYGLCHIHERKQYFLRFVSGQNWLSLLALAFHLPLLLFLSAGIHTIEDIDFLRIGFLIYSTTIFGFFTAYSLQVPWYIAAYIAFLSLSVDLVSSISLHAQ